MVPCPLCLAAAFSLAVRLDRDAWCFAAQVSHLVRSGTAGFGQSRQRPSSLALRLFPGQRAGRAPCALGFWFFNR